MDLKLAVLLVALVLGSTAFPQPEPDMSIFFGPKWDTSERIIGGTQAAVGSHPHMVALTTGTAIRSLLCGGSLIASRAVLTAAHCIRAAVSNGVLNGSLRLVVGTNRFNQGGVAYVPLRGIVHGSYVAATIKNDIGILQSQAHIAQNNLVRIIPLSFDWTGGGVNSRVAGWGRTSTGGSISVNLIQINVPTIDGNRCVNDVRHMSGVLNMGAPHVDPNLEICTFLAANRGTCNGDSGSALVRIDNGRQIGIVSWGLPCARGAPDVYARVSAYRAFINSYTLW